MENHHVKKHQDHWDLSSEGAAHAAIMAKTDSIPEYTGLRETLVRLQAAPVPDQPAIDRVIDELEQVQLRIKNEQAGIKGNNPNE